ncbi:UDP-glucose 4-epimerase [Cereibacter sphaeroides WS8N]|uniref:UDP-glucose 4-epimerase GalE n=1 Tax=Cereibacter sphaeroides TaxID=1063 RepID=UPI00020DF328|nr:UDP-glucose 4-epimerase GalE [Cereibacter sphaeroides]EGJ21609.1 UDP-glucose 4-epimerase [Cereibacter sphaeroides WS8N]
MPDTILVTGGAGFIGSHTCKALARAGHRPVSFDNLSTGHADAVRFGPLVQGDVRDPSAVEAALRAHGATAVIHFAASAYVGESMADPAKYYDNNVGGMIGLVQGCRAAGVSRIVFSSSCATYGTPDRLPIRETTPQRPINPYGRTKLIGEEILRDLGVEGMRHVALRYFNAAGADPEGELGERHDPETHLLPLALRAASGQGGPLAIFGTDYPTPDGTCIRDYIHVADLASAHVLALGRLMAGGESLAVNLGTGRGQSVREIVAAIERITGRAVPVRLEARRPGDPAELVADPALAAAELGFRTQLSDIGSIVRHAAPWFGLEPAHVEAA